MKTPRMPAPVVRPMAFEMTVSRLILAGALALAASGAKADATYHVLANGSFQQGGTASFTVTVGNSGVAPTTAAYTMTDPMPTGLTAGVVTSPDAGWNCSASTATNVSCTRSTALTAATASARSSVPSVTTPGP